jgi:hypothetical protein
MNDYHGQRLFSFRLPVTVAENLYAWLYLNEAFFYRRQLGTARQKETRKRLQVAAAEEAAGRK